MGDLDMISFLLVSSTEYMGVHCTSDQGMAATLAYYPHHAEKEL